MKVQIKKEILQKGIQIVQNIITPKSILPILSNLLVETQKNKLKLTSTDLDIGISVLLEAEIQEQGAITIPAKRLSDIIKELPDGEVEVVVKKNNVVYIRLGSCEFKLMGLPKEEFPKLPEFKDKEVIELDQVVLKEMLQLTSFAISHEETRYVLNGLLLDLKKHQHKEKFVLKLVATDGRRLALTEKELDVAANKEIKIIIPQKTITELQRNLKDDGKILIIITPNQVFFELDHTIIISRLIEGEFPDYTRVIPQAVETKIKADRQQLLQAVRRASLLSTPESLAVRMELSANKLVIIKTTPEIGESREEIAVDYKGKDLVIGFNPVYLIDVLRSLSGAFVELELSEAEKPGVIRTEEYLYLIQPMRLV
ncbi:MAG: DNA polymerase III subunit beta [Candidatus Omnitrophica bacterium]|nr:DNA polymerase III subunit beta [Candidatus Omnitrophota bacterium]MDD5351611.1 DNA polymerase III subunit beta [Candidatus Omnitrophota bacterium]MDD5550820.1 DNA polymerase III subunit beta [Candidatus Omnitrophota bacterium]